MVDIIIIGDSEQDIQALISLLHSQFALKYIILLKYFLRIEVNYL